MRKPLSSTTSTSAGRHICKQWWIDSFLTTLGVRHYPFLEGYPSVFQSPLQSAVPVALCGRAIRHQHRSGCTGGRVPPPLAVIRCKRSMPGRARNRSVRRCTHASRASDTSGSSSGKSILTVSFMNSGSGFGNKGNGNFGHHRASQRYC